MLINSQKAGHRDKTRSAGPCIEFCLDKTYFPLNVHHFVFTSMILLFFLYLLRTRELLVTGASNNERLQRNYFFSREAKNLMDNKSIYIAAPTYSVSIKKLKYVYKMAQGNAVV